MRGIHDSDDAQPACERPEVVQEAVGVLQTHAAQPARWAAPGHYPTTYTVKYDPATKEYQFVLGGMKKHGR